MGRPVAVVMHAGIIVGHYFIGIFQIVIVTEVFMYTLPPRSRQLVNQPRFCPFCWQRYLFSCGSDERHPFDHLRAATLIYRHTAGCDGY